MASVIAVSEIFGPTVQGEGPYTGEPTVFIRTGGCDFRCAWCADPDTPILLEDHTWKRAGDIEVGDMIVGQRRREAKNQNGYNVAIEAIGPVTAGQVLEVQTRPAEKVRVTFEDADDVVVAADHRFVRQKTGRFIQAHKLEPGDKLRYLGTWEQPDQDEWEIGYLAGAADGDGSFHDKPPTTSGFVPRHFTIATKDDVIVDKVETIVRKHGGKPTRGLHQAGGDFGPKYTMPIMRLCTREQVDHIEELAKTDRESRAWALGYFAGIYDTDGSTDSSKIRICQKKPHIRKRIDRVMRRLGFECVHEDEGLRVTSQMHEMRKLIGESQPLVARKRSPLFDRKCGHGAQATVKAVEPIGEGDVVSIKTDIGTYVAGGFMSKNCDSMHAVDPELAHTWRRMTAEQVLVEATALWTDIPRCSLTLSGGNPCLWEPLGDVAQHWPGKVRLETQGTFAPKWLHFVDTIVISPKPPSSAMDGAAQLEEFLSHVQRGQEIVFKVPVADEADLEWALEVYEKHFPSRPPFYITPVNQVHKDFDLDRLLAQWRQMVKWVNDRRASHVLVTSQTHVLAWGNINGV